jgi:hypothetical protein
LIIQQCGGNLETHIDRLIMNGGKESFEVDPEKRLQDINTLASRLVKSLDYAFAEQDLIDLVDKNIYQLLVKKLNELNELRNMKAA